MSIVEAEQQAAPVSVTVSVGGKDVTFETGKLAKQADGAVVVRSGETMVLATAQGRTEGRVQGALALIWHARQALVSCQTP